MRLTRDPVFGAINSRKILQADQKIKTDRIRAEPGYQGVMEAYERRV